MKMDKSKIDPKYVQLMDMKEDVPDEIPRDKLKHNLFGQLQYGYEDDDWDKPINLDDVSQEQLAVAMKMSDDFDSGKPKLDIYRKYNGGKYDGQRHKGVKAFNQAWNLMIKSMQYDIQNSDDRRADIYSKYMALYRIAFERGNIKEGRNVLDSLCRLLRLNLDQNPNTILIDKDNNVTISFGQ